MVTIEAYLAQPRRSQIIVAAARQLDSRLLDGVPEVQDVRERPTPLRHPHAASCPASKSESDPTMQPSPADDGPSVRDLNIRKPYFDQITQGAKTVEVRVAYPRMRTLQPGDRIRFVSGERHCLTVVRRVTTYDSIEAMLRAEDPASIAPDLPAVDELLDLIRSIYPPEKEALGVLAIQIERLDPD